MREKDCLNCKYMEEDEDGPHCKGCVDNEVDNWEMLTRAVHIKNISGIDLSLFLEFLKLHKDPTDEITVGDIEKWLQEPITEDDEE